MRPDRYAAVAGVLVRVLLLNLAVAIAKIVFGYASGAISILSDGFHSLTDASSNVVGLVGIHAARQPPDTGDVNGFEFDGSTQFLFINFADALRTLGDQPHTDVVGHFEVADHLELRATGR